MDILRLIDAFVNDKEIPQNLEYLSLFDRISVENHFVFLDGELYTEKYHKIDRELMGKVIEEKYRPKYFINGVIGCKHMQDDDCWFHINHEEIHKLPKNDKNRIIYSYVYLSSKQFKDREDFVSWYNLMFHTEGEEWHKGICGRFCKKCKKKSNCKELDFEDRYFKALAGQKIEEL